MFERIKCAISNCNSYICDKFGDKKSDIYVIGGAISVVTGVIFCCKATLQCEEILDEHKANIEKVHGACEIDACYAEEGAKKDTAIIYGRTCWRMFRKFAPGASLVGGGLYFIAKGYGLVKGERNTAIAAYNSLLAACNAKKNKEYEEIELDTGDILYKEKSASDDQITLDMTPDDYIIPFGLNNNNWHSETEWGPESYRWNLNFLNFQRKEMMRKLRAKKKLYMMDALELLGIPDCDIPNEGLARAAGWIEDSIKDDGEVMNDYKFFTIVEGNGSFAGTIWLKFNVDGIIIGRDV